MTEGNGKASKTRLSASTLLLSLIFGMMLTLPFKVIQKRSSEPLPSESRQELANRILKITEENDQLSLELTQLRNQYSQLEETLMQREQTSTELSQSRTTYRILAGLDAVHGPGIKLTLSENPSEIPPGSETARYVIHQEDLLNVVNEMWLAGAEAVAISSRNQTERLVLKSSIRCVGSLIDVNNTRMTPPFVISAIGSPDNLYGALTMPGGVLEPLGYYGIDTNIEKVDDMTLPAYGGSTLLQYAHPTGE